MCDVFFLPFTSLSALKTTSVGFIILYLSIHDILFHASLPPVSSIAAFLSSIAYALTATSAEYSSYGSTRLRLNGKKEKERKWKKMKENERKEKERVKNSC